MILRLICYDIENDAGRQKVAKTLESLGFYRLQYSVFCGSHNITQWARCKNRLSQLHKKYLTEDDKIYIINLSQQEFNKMDGWGQMPDFDLILDKKQTLWI